MKNLTEIKTTIMGILLMAFAAFWLYQTKDSASTNDWIVIASAGITGFGLLFVADTILSNFRRLVSGLVNRIIGKSKPK